MLNHNLGAYGSRICYTIVLTETRAARPEITTDIHWKYSFDKFLKR